MSTYRLICGARPCLLCAYTCVCQRYLTLLTRMPVFRNGINGLVKVICSLGRQPYLVWSPCQISNKTTEHPCGVTYRSLVDAGYYLPEHTPGSRQLPEVYGAWIPNPGCLQFWVQESSPGLGSEVTKGRTRLADNALTGYIEHDQTPRPIGVDHAVHYGGPIAIQPRDYAGCWCFDVLACWVP